MGDRVMGMGKSYLRRFAVLPALATMPVPDDVSLEDAATIPTAFITAHYALAHVGRLAAGEKVLIHLGSGGVGLAAIQVARHIGAEVLTTAGSDEKRARKAESARAGGTLCARVKRRVMLAQRSA